MPLLEGELQQFPTKFPLSKYTWEIKASKGVSHTSLTLGITRTSMGPVQLELCKDLLSTTATSPPSFFAASHASGSSASLLRFHLCTEDMRLLIDTDLAKMLNKNCKLRISDYLSANTVSIDRKAYALLGQALLSDFACVQLRGLMSIFHPDTYEPTSGWQDMARLRTLVDANSKLLPERFNDLEDEDHNEDAVDDYEDYHPLHECKCIDE